MELVNPELRDALPSSILSLPAIADSIEDAHGSIPATTLGHIESSVIQPLYDSQPVAIDAKGGIWEAEALLAKWKRGNTTWYLVKWRNDSGQGDLNRKIPAPKERIRAFGYRFILVLPYKSIAKHSLVL
jgi:hypothetical protein